MTQDEILDRIRYRLNAVDSFNLALRHKLAQDSAKSLKIYFDNELVIKGNSNAWVNPAIEAGLVHCRALLEFIGLKLCHNCAETGTGLLTNITSRRPDDIGIEQLFDKTGKALSLVAPQEVLKRYAGSRNEAEGAIAEVFHVTNKGLVHFTDGLTDSPDRLRLLEIASRGIPAIVISHVFTALGLPEPDYKNESQLRREKPKIEGGT
jgi:hypothetical protein